MFGERYLTNVSRHLLDGYGIDGLLFGKGRIVFVLRDRRLGIVLGRSNLSRQDKARDIKAASAKWRSMGSLS